MKLIINGYNYTRFVLMGTNALNDVIVAKETWEDGNGKTHKSGIRKKAIGEVELLLRTREAVNQFRNLMQTVGSGGLTSITATMVNTGLEKTFDAYIEAELSEDIYNEHVSISKFRLNIEEA